MTTTINENPETDEAKAYFLALGEFIDQFARTEMFLHVILRHYAKINWDVGAAILSGVRVDTAMSFIKRITEIHDPGEETRIEINDLFQQLAEVNKLRNDIVHYGSQVRDDVRIVSNRIAAHTHDRIREFSVSPQTLKDAATDLNAINVRLSFRVLHHMPIGLHKPFEPILNAPWRYKPPQRDSNRRKHRDTPQGQ